MSERLFIKGVAGAARLQDLGPKFEFDLGFACGFSGCQAITRRFGFMITTLEANLHWIPATGNDREKT